MAPLGWCLKKVPAAAHFNSFKLLVVSPLLSLVSRSNGYRLQFIAIGKRSKIYQRFEINFGQQSRRRSRSLPHQAAECD
jgi:hypothetical protein